MSVGTWLTYAAICLLFSATPGPSVILSVGQGIARGFQSGLKLVAGIQVGNAIYFAISAAGLGAVLAASEVAFLTLKYAGAAYLIVIGLATIKNALRAVDHHDKTVAPIWRQPFVQGLLNQLANPKSILFFGAMFPQFVNYSAPSLLPQFLILGTTIIVIDGAILLLYVAVAASGKGFVRDARSVRLREILSGSALIGVGGAFGLRSA